MAAETLVPKGTRVIWLSKGRKYTIDQAHEFIEPFRGLRYRYTVEERTSDFVLFRDDFIIMDGEVDEIKGAKGEMRVLSDVKVICHKDGKTYTIGGSYETDNPFGHGVYAYQVKENNDLHFILHRKDFDILRKEDPLPLPTTASVEMWFSFDEFTKYLNGNVANAWFYTRDIISHVKVTVPVMDIIGQEFDNNEWTTTFTVIRGGREACAKEAIQS